MEEKKQMNSPQDEVRLMSFEGVKKFKSIKRAIKRGNASIYGEVFPKRPFNNRKPTRGRSMNEDKKRIYGEIKRTL